ncbi:MAG: ATP-dependent helicase, partial [Rubrivivax sp.]|nr:ATP-dependent helicase [Rubrivivax sp.]
MLLARPPSRRPDPAEATTPGHFQPRLTLQTLSRGDGLLGLRAMAGFGPRSAALTVAQVDWTYRTDAGQRWQMPAPERVLSSKAVPAPLLRGAWGERVLLQRDASAEADARDALW